MNHARVIAFDARERRVLRIVDTFFSAFTAGHVETARICCQPQFSWFGRVIDSEGWTTPRARAFHRDTHMSYAKPRSLPEALVLALKSRFEDEYLFEGPVGLEDMVALVDVTVSGQAVTVGVVVEDIEGEGKIARVFDPTDLRSALERLGNSDF
jgi:hypothetical protein